MQRVSVQKLADDLELFPRTPNCQTAHAALSELLHMPVGWTSESGSQVRDDLTTFDASTLSVPTSPTTRCC